MNSISLRILSLFKIFELKKVSLSRILTRDWYFEEKISKTKWFEFWAYSKSHACAVTCIWHLPRTFWAYSRYLRISYKAYDGTHISSGFTKAFIASPFLSFCGTKNGTAQKEWTWERTSIFQKIATIFSMISSSLRLQFQVFARNHRYWDEVTSDERPFKSTLFLNFRTFLSNGLLPKLAVLTKERKNLKQNI